MKMQRILLALAACSLPSAYAPRAFGGALLMCDASDRPVCVVPSASNCDRFRPVHPCEHQPNSEAAQGVLSLMPESMRSPLLLAASAIADDVRTYSCQTADDARSLTVIRHDEAPSMALVEVQIHGPMAQDIARDHARSPIAESIKSLTIRSTTIGIGCHIGPGEAYVQCGFHRYASAEAFDEAGRRYWLDLGISNEGLKGSVIAIPGTPTQTRVRLFDLATGLATDYFEDFGWNECVDSADGNASYP